MDGSIAHELRIGCLTVVTAWQKIHCCSSSPSMQIINLIKGLISSPFPCKMTGCSITSHCFALPSDISLVYVSLVCILSQCCLNCLLREYHFNALTR